MAAQPYAQQNQEHCRLDTILLLASLMRVMNEASSRVLEQWQETGSERLSQELDGFQGILFGVVVGGLLWLGLVWFVFSVL